MASLRDFMVSKVRVKLLSLFFKEPEEMFYVRELTRKVGEEINAVRRELTRLQNHGIVRSEIRGNRLYYSLQKNYPFYQELLHLIAKTTGLGGAIRKNRNKLGKLKFVMLSGKYIRGKPRQQNEVDLLVVGNVVLPQLAALVREEEAKKEGEINYTVMTTEEFQFRQRRRDPFLLNIISGSRAMVIGDEDELVAGSKS